MSHYLTQVTLPVAIEFQREKYAPFYTTSIITILAVLNHSPFSKPTLKLLLPSHNSKSHDEIITLGANLQKKKKKKQSV